jgi:uncharacterized integral membrane protein (TIGR00698 family)
LTKNTRKVLNVKENYRGALLTLSLALLAYFVAPLTQSVNSIVFGLFLGILAGNLLKIPASFSAGIGFSGSKLLELSIVFLAFSINYSHIKELGASSFIVIVLLVLFVLLITVLLSKKMNCPGSTGYLIGFGTTICGSSAIAALSPSISKGKEDVGIAMAVVNLFGVLGMVTMPLVLEWFSANSVQSGMLLGGTLHSVGNVAGAGYAMSKEVGELALTVKLARVSLLSPALIFFNILVNKDAMKNWYDYFKLPWYLWLFVLITLSTSFFEYSLPFIKTMSFMGDIALTTAMVAIGLKVSVRLLYISGKRGLVFGALIFAVQILVLLALMQIPL